MSSVFAAPDGGLLTDTLNAPETIMDGEPWPEEPAFQLSILSEGADLSGMGCDFFFHENEVAQMPCFAFRSSRYSAPPRIYYSFGRAIVLADRKLIVINAEGTIEAEHEVDFSVYSLDHVSNHDYILISETSIQKFSPDFQRLEWRVELPDVLDSYKIFNGVVQVYAFNGTKVVFDGLTGKTVER